MLGGSGDHENLQLVMDEIKDAMGAQATALTLHRDDADQAFVVFTDEAAGLSAQTVTDLLVCDVKFSDTDRPNVQRWVDCAGGGKRYNIMLIPVSMVAGHSRLLIHVYFDDLSEERRQLAEAVYLERRPFAVGYFRLWQQNRARERKISSLEAALNLTEMAVMLVDRAGILTFANRAAEDMLSDGSGLRMHNRMVRASRLRDSVRLQMAIEHVIAVNGRPDDLDGDSSAPMLSLERKDAPPLIVSIMPSDEQASEPNDVAAIIYALDPMRNLQDMLISVCKVYRLSPVEAHLTRLVVGGATLAEAAKMMRVKEMTARSYLKQVFLKTNTHRQAELIQLMLSSIIRTTPAVIASPLEAA